MNTELKKAIEAHRRYVSMGLDIRAALANVTANLTALDNMKQSRTYSNDFCEAIQAEINRLNIESSAMHVVIREMEGAS